MNELFFELIRVSIGTQDRLSRIPSKAEWEELYDMAEKQSLVGVCFYGLKRMGADADDGFERVGMSETMYMEWMIIASNVQQKNTMVNQQCAELQAKLFADGYRSYIMKGQSVASLYGKHLSGLRQSGDIDVYIDGGLEKVLTCAKKYGGASRVNELEMYVNVFEDTIVEFHYRPFIMRNPWKNMRLQDFFDSQKEACFENKIILSKESVELRDEVLEITAPTTEFNLVHQIAHIHLHLFTEGVGMRQLMDLYFVLRNTNYNELPTHFSEIYKQLGLERFVSALMWIMEYVFGLPKEQMLCESNEKDGKFLLDEIMTAGNFGKHDEILLERKSKTGYGLWALFIRNLKFSRFDRGDWFWGPLWRVYHFVWRKIIAERLEGRGASKEKEE